MNNQKSKLPKKVWLPITIIGSLLLVGIITHTCLHNSAKS